jgi:hypothetical protein
MILMINIKKSVQEILHQNLKWPIENFASVLLTPQEYKELKGKEREALLIKRIHLLQKKCLEYFNYLQMILDRIEC